jgi:hypothetical protein
MAVPVTASRRRKLTESEADKLVVAGKTPRACELERLQAYYEGTQDDGKPPYLDVNGDTPRLERKPCINYKIVKAAVRSRVALAMGGTRFPVILSQSSEDDSKFDPRFGLDQKSSETLDQFNAKLFDVCGLAACLREAMRIALASRSVALIGCMRRGMPYIDTVWPAICTPTFDPNDPDTVVSLEIRFRFKEYWRDAQLTSMQWAPLVKEYRRVIDAKTDTTFVAKEVWDIEDVDPSQTADTVIAHGFGFCPVAWYARGKTSYAVGSYDGAAIHDGMFTDVDGINHALSSRHLAAMYTGDPVRVATGVSQADPMGTLARTARSPAIPGQPKTEWDNALYGSNGKQAIRIGPGELLRVEDPSAKVQILTLPPGALEAVSAHAADVCSKTRENLQYVWLDPEQLTGAGDVSGKTLAFIFATEVNAVNEDRDNFGRRCLLPSLGLVYRMMLAKDPAELYVPGIAKAVPVLQKFLVKFDGGQQAFIAPQLKIKWGAMFEPSDVDEATRAATATSALTAGIITKKSAVEHVKDVFEIGNTDQYVDALDKEADDKAAKAVDQAQKMASVTGPPKPGAAGASKPAPNAAKPAALAPLGLQKQKKAS